MDTGLSPSRCSYDTHERSRTTHDTIFSRNTEHHQYRTAARVPGARAVREWRAVRCGAENESNMPSGTPPSQFSVLEATAQRQPLHVLEGTKAYTVAPSPAYSANRSSWARRLRVPTQTSTKDASWPSRGGTNTTNPPYPRINRPMSPSHRAVRHSAQRVSIIQVLGG